MIMYRENIVSNRVRDDVARQRYKQAFSIVRKGSIVCVSHCIVPPEIPLMSGSDRLLLHLPDTTYLITPWQLSGLLSAASAPCRR